MNYQNNIKLLEKSSFGQCLIKVGTDDKLSKVHLLGKIVRWIKSLATKKSFDDCKIAKIANVLKNMVESNKLGDDDKLIIKKKFNEILAIKTLKEPNKKTIQEIYQNLFPAPKDLKNGTNEKVRISELTKKVATEGFAAMQSATNADLLAVVEEFTKAHQLDIFLLIIDAKDPTKMTSTPLLHTAINSLDKDKALLVARSMIEKGANPNHYSVRINSGTSFQSHAMVLADQTLNYPLKNYFIDFLSITDEQQKELFNQADGIKDKTIEELKDEINYKTFEDLIENLNTLSKTEIFEKIDLIAKKKQLDKVKVATYEDGSEEQFSLMVAAYHDIDEEKIKWDVINKLIDSGADANTRLVTKNAAGKVKNRTIIALKIFKLTMQNWNTFSYEELLRNVKVCVRAGLVNMPQIKRKGSIAETRYLILNAAEYLKGEQRTEIINLLLENGADHTVRLITQNTDDGDLVEGKVLDQYVKDDPVLKDLLANKSIDDDGGFNEKLAKWRAARLNR